MFSAPSLTLKSIMVALLYWAVIKAVGFILFLCFLFFSMGISFCKHSSVSNKEPNSNGSRDRSASAHSRTTGLRGSQGQRLHFRGGRRAPRRGALPRGQANRRQP